MTSVRRFVAATMIALVLPVSVLSAPGGVAARAANANRVVLHSPIHAMGFQHVMAVAGLRYGTDDIFINFHAMDLPSPHVLHQMAYVLWAVNGSNKENVGALHIHNMMSSLKTKTMMHTLQDLMVTAEASPSVSAPHGRVVLSGIVG